MIVARRGSTTPRARVLVVDASAFASWAFPDQGGSKVSQALIRVMAEGDDPALVEKVVDDICEAVQAAA